MLTLPAAALEQLAELVAARMLAQLQADARPGPGQPARLLTLVDVVDRLGLSNRTVRELIATGALPAVKVAGRVKVRDADLEAYLRAHAVAPRRQGGPRPAVVAPRLRPRGRLAAVLLARPPADDAA